MFEHYLIEQKDYIIAISKLSKIINNTIKENYYNFLKGNIDKKCIDEIIAMNTTISIISYFMRLKRFEYYKQIDETYDDKFNFNDYE